MSQRGGLACEDLVRNRDPERYRAAMSAPAAQRPALMALYAFNSEIFHAVWATYEPGLAEIRLAYWRDQIEALYGGGATDALPVLEALRAADVSKRLPKAELQALIAARGWDADSAPFDAPGALMAYLRDTSGGLMAMAGRLLGAGAPEVAALKDYGQAAGLAAFFLAVPEFARRARGRPLDRFGHAALSDLAGAGLALMDEAREKAPLRRVLPALLSATEARPLLKRAQRAPALIAAGGLARAPLRQRARVLACVLLNRW